MYAHGQWLKCNWTQGNAVPPPPIYGSKRSPTSDCYNARERHTTIVRGPNLNVAFPHLQFCTLITVHGEFLSRVASFACFTGHVLRVCFASARCQTTAPQIPKIDVKYHNTQANNAKRCNLHIALTARFWRTILELSFVDEQLAQTIARHGTQ